MNCLSLGTSQDSIKNSSTPAAIATQYGFVISHAAEREKGKGLAARGGVLYGHDRNMHIALFPIVY